jgi:hypothetical protein
MPCTFDPTPEEEASMMEENAKDSKAFKALLKKHKDLTRFACALVKQVQEWDEDQGSDSFGSLEIEIPGLREWWEEHEKTDAQRKQELRVSVLQKLEKHFTTEERAALGIQVDDWDEHDLKKAKRKKKR